jgi:hypothetical protein
MTLPLSRSLIGAAAVAALLLTSFSGSAAAMTARSYGSAASSTGSMPSAQEIEQMIQKKTGATINWKAPIGRSSHFVKLTGTGTMSTDLRFKIDCYASYPPLKIGCTITFSL